MSIRDEDHIELEMALIDKGKKAWLIEGNDGVRHWIPFSQGEYIGRGKWRLTKWIAQQKGIL